MVRCSLMNGSKHRKIDFGTLISLIRRIFDTKLYLDTVSYIKVFYRALNEAEINRVAKACVNIPGMLLTGSVPGIHELLPAESQSEV